MPGLYAEDEEVKKPAPRRKKRKSSSSCKDAWLDKIMKDDDTDGNGSSQVVQKDAYSFCEESQEQDQDDGNNQQLWDDEEDGANANASEGFSTPVGSSLSFNNPQLSMALGPLNNPYRSSGWVKTRCGGGGSPSASECLPDLVSDNEDDGDLGQGSADPMWGPPVEELGSDDNIQLFEDPLAESTKSESDVEQGN